MAGEVVYHFCRVAPGDEAGGTFEEEDESNVEGEMGEGPELLSDGAETFGVDLVKVEHVEEILVGKVS